MVRDSYGSEVVTWTTHGHEVWASSWERLGKATEKFHQGRQQA